MKPERNSFTDATAWPVRDPEHLRECYEAATALVAAEQIMLQELIPGGRGAQLSFAAGA